MSLDLGCFCPTDRAGGAEKPVQVVAMVPRVGRSHTPSVAELGLEREKAAG